MSKNKNARILSNWFQRVPYSLVYLMKNMMLIFLPYQRTSLFDPFSIDYSEVELKKTCKKSFTGYYYETPEKIFNRLIRATKTQALS